MDLDMTDGHIVRTGRMVMQHGHAAGILSWIYSMGIQSGHPGFTWSIDNMQRHAARTCSEDTQHRCMDMQQRIAACNRSMDSMNTQHGHATWTRSMDVDMQYGRGHAAWTRLAAGTCSKDKLKDMLKNMLKDMLNDREQRQEAKAGSKDNQHGNVA